MNEALITFAIEAEAVAGLLDGLDYFQVLKVEKTASVGELKAAFYRESRQYHPDRVFHVDDPALKANVHKVYKRITEAWSVLRDDEKRRKYLADVSGPQREQKLRWTEESEVERKKAREEEVGTTPNGRKFFAAGVVALDAGRLDEAVRSFKAALMYEPQNPRYKEKAEEAQRRARGGAPA
ncbi:J domain-containing protein [Vulgatibacter sp.]|uniref:J domain-containing protein n=1 Tax=Vulgatibacter sp. TaxID=1971226 RepID=UPI003564E7A4